MKILDRYIGRMLVVGTLVAMAVLLSLLGVLQLANELNDVGKGHYGVTDAFAYVALIMPGFAYELFPIGALLGSLGGLGILAGRSELVAMRASGMSVARIAISIMKTGLLLVCLVILLGELIAPVSEQQAQNLRAQAISNQITLNTKYGFWARDGQAFVNIRKILSGTSLADIYIYDYDSQRRLKKATHAASAHYERDHWLLMDVKRTEITPDGTTSEELRHANWSSLIDPGVLSILVVKPNVLPIWGLHRYIEFMRENGENATAYQVAFWGKLINPLVTLVMLLLSVPFVFGPLRTVSLGQRIFVGAMVGGGFFFLNKAVSHIAVAYGLSPLVAASLPAALLLGTTLLMMRRVY